MQQDIISESHQSEAHGLLGLCMRYLWQTIQGNRLRSSSGWAWEAEAGGLGCSRWEGAHQVAGGHTDSWDFSVFEQRGIYVAHVTGLASSNPAWVPYGLVIWVGPSLQDIGNHIQIDMNYEVLRHPPAETPDWMAKFKQSLVNSIFSLYYMVFCHFQVRSMYLNHLKTHGERRKFSCFICQREFFHKHSLEHHLYSHTSKAFIFQNKVNVMNTHRGSR